MKKIFFHFFIALTAFLILALLSACSGAASDEESSEEKDASQKPAAEELEIPYTKGPTEPPSISAPKTKPPQ